MIILLKARRCGILYCMVRNFLPSKIIEIGSGYSTLLIQKAVSDIRLQKPEYKVDPICIEPMRCPGWKTAYR
jgi:hypothetical protein